VNKAKQRVSPLPVSWQECEQRGWNSLDILLITGDAYVDHPSFGIALIGRLVEARGYRVAVLSQPRIDTNNDFKAFPPPRLFCGITAGNLDSIVANYTGNGKVRDRDSYSPNGNPWRTDAKEKNSRRRPDRATIVYTTLAKSSYPGVPIVLGGIEASLRRFVHFDYKQNKLRASILADAKADILVYGMGEKAVLEIAERCRSASPGHADFRGINGTCQRLTDAEFEHISPAINGRKTSRTELFLPSYEEITKTRALFLDAEVEIDRHARSYSPRMVYQRQQSHWVAQYPAAKPLTTEELDQLYALPFTRRPHPEADIPALQMIKDSITIVRGCPGNCSFCAISRHQGPAVASRSNQSIIRECQEITRSKSFKGTISDLGGPTANLFGSSCKIGGCKKHDCLYPRMCANLQLDEDRFLELLDAINKQTGIKNVFISSGLRMEPLLHTPRLFRRILQHHTPGALKIAPEHTEPSQLQLMHKEQPEVLIRFVDYCRMAAQETGKGLMLTPYIIISHPGSTPEHVSKLVEDLNHLGLQARQFQDFTPTPGTMSTAMYVTGLDPRTRKPITVPKNQSERNAQRAILEQQYLRTTKKAVRSKHRTPTTKGRKK